MAGEMFISSHDVAALACVKQSTVYSWKHRRDLHFPEPEFMVNSKNYYAVSKILDWMKEHDIKPIEQGMIEEGAVCTLLKITMQELRFLIKNEPKFPKWTRYKQRGFIMFFKEEEILEFNNILIERPAPKTYMTLEMEFLSGKHDPKHIQEMYSERKRLAHERSPERKVIHLAGEW